MYLPPLQPIWNDQTFMSGDVVIDPSAVIAPGVMLQAAPNCQLKIAAGVCVGMGAIINACQGNLDIEVGVVLGAGVIIMGQGRIGANACVGASTTILNPVVAPMQVIGAGSILGVPGLVSGTEMPKTSEASASHGMSTVTTPVVPEVPEELRAQIETPPEVPEELRAQIETPPEVPAPGSTTSLQTTEQPESSTSTQETESEASAGTIPQISARVYGQAHVSRMMKTLFPHTNFNNLSPDDDD